LDNAFESLLIGAGPDSSLLKQKRDDFHDHDHSSRLHHSTW
jgi:hypothetical protein